MPPSSDPPRRSYTAHAPNVMAEHRIPLAWVEQVLRRPDRDEPDRSDPALRHPLGRIKAHDGRVLRVIYNANVVPPRILTAYFDRSLRNQL